MTSEPLNILLIGFGNMGRALYQGWLSQKHTITIVDPAIDAGEHRFNSVNDQVRSLSFDLIVLAVKPQILEKVLEDYTFLKNSDAVVLSIMAGVSIKSLTDFFGDNTPVIRCMPNTPSMVGKGMSVCVANQYVTVNQKQDANALLCTVGQVAWVDDEDLMHGVTAVSGSGPAYVFYLIETMVAAGVAAGLSKDLAIQLARETVIGSAELANQSDASPSTLRKSVTSPGGTTQAALDILMMEEGGLKDLMTAAIKSATQRSKDLA